MMPDRYVDLLKQGFMKPRKARKKRVKGPTVACEACQNWHEQGRHTKKLPRGTRAVQRVIDVPKNLQHLIAPGETTLDPRILRSESAGSADIHRRIARALGWTGAETRGYSLRTLRDLVRPVDPGLADEISHRIASGKVLF